MKETISIELDRPRELRLRLCDLTALEREIKEDPLELLDKVWTVDPDGKSGRCRSIWALQALLYAALRWEDSTITLSQAADLVAAYARQHDGSVVNLAASVRAAHLVGDFSPVPDDRKNALAEAIGTATISPSASANGSATPDTSPTSSVSDPESGLS